VSDITRLVWQALVVDSTDTSTGNPSLLTLANRSPQRIAAATGTGPPRPTAGLFSATTIAGGGAAAGQAVVPVASSVNYRDLMWIWLGGVTPEVMQVKRGGVAAGQLTLSANLGSTHASGSLVSPLPTIIHDVEPRIVVDTPDFYWCVVVGPEHEFPTPQPKVRPPVRLYETFLIVKVYDSSPSRKLAEDVRDRLDYLLNLGEAGGPNPSNTGINPSPLLGVASPQLRSWIEKIELEDGGEPHFDYSSLTLSVPLHFKVHFSKVYS